MGRHGTPEPARGQRQRIGYPRFTGKIGASLTGPVRPLKNRASLYALRSVQSVGPRRLRCFLLRCFAATQDKPQLRRDKGG